MTLDNLKEIAYCKLNLSFNSDVFIKEYDEYILPNSRPIVNGLRSWELTRSINRAWGMVDPDIYDTCNVQDTFGSTIIDRGSEQWQAISLIEAISNDPNIYHKSLIGSVVIRNNYLGEIDYRFKEMYKDLEISKWIQKLPLSKLIGVRCVSLKPGTFASIHRDENNINHQKNGSSISNNKLWNAGFVTITLNLSDGGYPIYTALDSNLNDPIMINDQVYLFNDYCIHGVPVVNTRRRQIRITGKPTTELIDSMCPETITYIGKLN